MVFDKDVDEGSHRKELGFAGVWWCWRGGVAKRCFTARV